MSEPDSRPGALTPQVVRDTRSVIIGVTRAESWKSKSGRFLMQVDTFQVDLRRESATLGRPAPWQIHRVGVSGLNSKGKLRSEWLRAQPQWPAHTPSWVREEAARVEIESNWGR